MFFNFFSIDLFLHCFFSISTFNSYYLCMLFTKYLHDSNIQSSQIHTHAYSCTHNPTILLTLLTQPQSHIYVQYPTQSIILFCLNNIQIASIAIFLTTQIPKILKYKLQLPITYPMHCSMTCFALTLYING